MPLLKWTPESGYSGTLGKDYPAGQHQGAQCNNEWKYEGTMPLLWLKLSLNINLRMKKSSTHDKDFR